MTIAELRGRADVPVVIADQDGIITYVNAPFEILFGYRADEVIGEPLSIIIPKNLRDSHHMGFSRFLATGKPTLLDKPIRLKAELKDGRVVDAEHTIIAEQEGGRWVFGATICPMGAP